MNHPITDSDASPNEMSSHVDCSDSNSNVSLIGCTQRENIEKYVNAGLSTTFQVAGRNF